jgi:hypothetical protein
VARNILAFYHTEEGIEYLKFDRSVLGLKAKGKVKTAQEPSAIRAACN